MKEKEDRWTCDGRVENTPEERGRRPSGWMRMISCHLCSECAGMPLTKLLRHPGLGLVIM